jgi:hypothetical protein
VVAELMHPGVPGRLDTRGPKRGLPHVIVKINAKVRGSPSCSFHGNVTSTGGKAVGI